MLYLTFHLRKSTCELVHKLIILTKHVQDKSERGFPSHPREA
jgi:hypothetical protein